jgi:hypothetical protein
MTLLARHYTGPAGAGIRYVGCIDYGSPSRPVNRPPFPKMVEFRGWTPAGELRHAVFKGWHEG